MPTIPFGINRETGKEVHVDDATKKDKYVCVACGQPLILNEGPKLGKFFKHFRPDEDCILIKYGSTNFPTGPYKEPNDGIHQHFPEWMAYLRALKEGDKEKAATLWDFEIPKQRVIDPVPIEKLEPPMEELEIDLPTPIEEMEPEMEKHSLPEVIEEHKALITIGSSGDDLEWVTNQAMLKPIVGGMVRNCPLTNLSVSADQCEDGCKYFVEFQQPQIDPDKPNVVICKGHHENARPTILFDGDEYF
ncbi:hypothetical protein [Thermoactinomyces sp. CICC 10522]|uniref:DUF7830 domain-containing protein n=1 Tax=Thermoactinomyces sp. CICC 10522 TaxID=2767427 RepID=UPI0018DEAC73|nr:hypothetical protein [Thermoactinomyces sp. CICC 10522]MBH8605590.1 hypothetical protein [Thermoactinomyces sp. CICC 10522]